MSTKIDFWYVQNVVKNVMNMSRIIILIDLVAKIHAKVEETIHKNFAKLSLHLKNPWRHHFDRFGGENPRQS